MKKYIQKVVKISQFVSNFFSQYIEIFRAIVFIVINELLDLQIIATLNAI